MAAQTQLFCPSHALPSHQLAAVAELLGSSAARQQRSLRDLARATGISKTAVGAILAAQAGSLQLAVDLADELGELAELTRILSEGSGHLVDALGRTWRLDPASNEGAPI